MRHGSRVGRLARQQLCVIPLKDSWRHRHGSRRGRLRVRAQRKRLAYKGTDADRQILRMARRSHARDDPTVPTGIVTRLPRPNADGRRIAVLVNNSRRTLLQTELKDL
jgi:hypothetical protein